MASARYVERQLITRSERGDHGAAIELLESLRAGLEAVGGARPGARPHFEPSEARSAK